MNHLKDNVLNFVKRFKLLKVKSGKEIKVETQNTGQQVLVLFYIAIL